MLLVYPVCELLYKFIPDQHAFARPPRDARTHSTARRPRSDAAFSARRGTGLACPPASLLTRCLYS
eukprot:6214692-Pleurochrysis_carterae.AAC.5